jgi:predicted ATPase
MITHIRVKNFKSWKDTRKVDLAPLTGFFGTNSSGKSSLLQMLLLLKQTVGREEVIFFGDKNSVVNLGDFREIIHGHKEELLEFEFGGKLPQPLTITTLQEIDKYSQRYEFVPSDIDSFTFDTAIRENASGMSIDYFSYTVGPEAIDKIQWENRNLYYGDKFATSTSRINCYGHQTKITDQFLSPLSSAFEKLFSHVYYLGPTRVHTQRLYHWEKTHPQEIDMWGNEAVDALLSARIRQLTTTHNGKRVSIEERISKWLQKMELAHSFSLVPKGSLDDNNYEIRIQKTANSAEVTLVDLGHGVSDLFPLLVHCCYVPEGSTLILEQPGVHLHPKAQADLADLLIEVITERNLQILMESHSEHLLTRLQRRIAEKKISQDDTALYFCRNDDGVSTIEPLDITEFGEIKNWPENFFGDVMGDMFAMTDQQAKRMIDQNTED